MCIVGDMFVADALASYRVWCVTFALFPLRLSELVLFHSHGFEEMPSSAAWRVFQKVV